MMEISSPAPSQIQTSEPARPSLDVGAALRSAREAAGMSVHDVAERIKFAPRQVEALEMNDFAILPQATFLRGFVRSYARVLQMDEAALLAALPCEPTRHKIVNAQSVEVAFPAIRSLQGINILWLAGALGILLVLGLFLWVSDSKQTTQKPEVVLEPVALPTESVAASTVAATEVRPSGQTSGTALKAPELKNGATSSRSTESQKLPELAKPVESKRSLEDRKTPEPVVKTVVSPEPQPNAASAVATTIPLEVLKRRPLHFVFKESSWTEVLDSRGVVLLSRVNPRGTEKWVGGPRHEPYDISIAHPANVKLYYRGKEIDLSAYAGMDVVHLKLE